MAPTLLQGQLICTQCAHLTSKVHICLNCHDSLPLDLSFVPDKRLSRRELADPAYYPDFETVKMVIHQAESRLAKFDHIITQLTASREALSSFIAYQKSRTAPINRLPPEILASIFSIVLSDAGENQVFVGSLPTLKLSHVSTSWRRLITASPSLWTEISLVAPTTRSMRYRRNKKELVAPDVSRRELLSMYLNNSRSHPLRLKLWLSRWQNRAEFYSLTAAISDHAGRWAKLEVAAMDVPGLSSSIGPRLRALRKLKLLGPSFSEDETPLTIFSHAPVLAEVDTGHHSLHKFPLPKGPVRHLVMEDITPTNLLAITPLAEYLVTLSLCDIYSFDDLGDAQRPSSEGIIFPTLKKITLRIGRDVAFFLSFLNSPALEELNILNVDMTHETTGPQHAAGFLSGLSQDRLSQLQHTLTSLSITSSHVHPNILVDTLRNLGALRHLSLYRLVRGFEDEEDGDVLDVLSDTFFEALGGRHEAEFLMPCLETLTLSTDAQNVDENIFKSFLKARLGNPNMKKMELDFIFHTFSLGIVKWVRESDFGSERLVVKYRAAVGSFRFPGMVKPMI